MYNENMRSYFVYMLCCSDDSFYIGSTSDLPKRISEHELGVIVNSYTHSRRPVQLVWAQEFPSHEEAFTFERQIKGWSRAKKKALIRGDWEEIHKIVRDERKRREREKRTNSHGP
jgi:predicted GIY-YIG superfamily endonuclease